jgi:hypothetical protein
MHTLIAQDALRWLSKALGAYGVQGALTDVVNVICAMMSVRAPLAPKPSMQAVEALMAQFTREVMSGQRVTDLWVPTHMIQDAEFLFTMSLHNGPLIFQERCVVRLRTDCERKRRWTTRWPGRWCTTWP